MPSHITTATVPTLLLSAARLWPDDLAGSTNAATGGARERIGSTSAGLSADAHPSHLDTVP